ncbi:MAG: PadR family transcriptional regulator [Actinomycetota bacterium]|nr:PadR family transcriptional regulator [Actinomycetota bacterium]
MCTGTKRGWQDVWAREQGWTSARARWRGEDDAGGAGGPRRGRRRHGFPGWAMGGMGGPGLGFPWGGPGRPRSRRGDVRLAVLRLLAEQPMHGYQMITELAERSGGAWRPSPGSIYPTLQQLEDEGLVTVSEQDGRRTFSLTDAGRAEAQRASAGRGAPWDDLAAEDAAATRSLRATAFQVMGAVVQVAAAGDERQLGRAETLLKETRKALYRLLAEDDDGTGPEDGTGRADGA